jgi:hypothetical protein
MRIVFTSLALLALAAGCQTSAPAHPVASSVPPPPPPASSPTADAGEALASDPLASIKARGALHVDPIKLPPSPRSSVDRWLVFLGTKEIARAAWVVAPGDEKSELTPVENWPAGVTVKGSVERQGVVYLLLETVAILDQPAGIRAVWFDAFGNGSPFALASQSAFAGVKEIAELEKRLDAGPPPAHAMPPDGALMALLKSAQGSEAALAKIVSPSGVDLFDVWQSTFTSLAEHVEPQKLAVSPHAPAMLSIVRDAIKADQCEADVCEAQTDRGRATIDFAQENGKWVIRAFEWDSSPPAPAQLTAPKVVNASPTTKDSEQVFAEHVRTTKQVLGEAPLSSRGGSIGVALTDRESNGPTIAIREGEHSRVFALSSLSFVAAQANDVRFEARFADLDGDGRTDAIVRATGTSKDGTPLAFAQAFLAPPPSVQIGELFVDHATELSLLGAPTIDAAVQAALSVPARGIATADACKLLTGANVLPTFRKIATADVRVLSFEEPAMPTYRARVVTESKLRPEDVRDAGKRCKELECSATRPLCSYADGPYNEYYWFTWDNNVMRLAGAAFYNGT